MSMRLVLRSLGYYWRTNTAVVAGVAAAVTVLAGALMVGDSVRGSLRDLVIQRLGRTDLVVLSADFFRAGLADDIRTDSAFDASFADAQPIVVVQGLASEQSTGRRASRVQVYGVDERFWRFHGIDSPPDLESRGLLLSPALAQAIGAAKGSAVLLRVPQPSTMPLESMHGRKDDLGRTLRLTVSAVLSPADLGEFSLQPQQGDVLAAFVPLARLQEDLGVGDRVNALLVSARTGATPDPASLEAFIRRHATLADVGLTLQALEPLNALSLETERGLIDDTRAAAARAAATPLRLQAQPVLTYLVNTIRFADRAIPYSLISAVDLDLVAPGLEVEDSSVPPIVLNDWAARDLGANVGDRLTLEYFVWQDPGRLVTATTDVAVARIVPMTGAAADRDLAPDYPGITGSENVQDWDPPFPIDLGRIRPIDERYWDEHRATPKGFIPLAAGDALWRSRYGALTAIRFTPPSGMSLAGAHAQLAASLGASLDPLALGMAVRAPRADGLAASRGATNFGEYFTYFSFFLVVSAVTLAALFFKLGVEQRVREIGLLRAVGFNARDVRRQFATEALILSLIGSAIGVVGALGYGWLMMTGLRTLWIDAVGTKALSLHVSWLSLLAGAAGGVAAALVCIWWTLRALGRVSERSLLSGQLASDMLEDVSAGRPFQGRRRRRGVPDAAVSAVAFLLLGIALVLLGFAERIDQTGAFFGAGASLLVASLSAVSAWLRRPSRALIAGRGWWPVSRLGLRNAAYRPARSVLSVGVMASATFILISVDAFRRDDGVDAANPHSGTGGYTLMVETLLPFAHDPGSEEGRDLLGLSSRGDVDIAPFRVLPGDDASCLNLYEPRQPRIIAPGPRFIAEGRFRFQSSLADSDEERENPWRLLLRDYPDGAVPVIADANSMTYVLHRRLGEEIVIGQGGRNPLRLRLVAALSDSMLQGELVMSDANFLKLFPEQEGYGLLLVDARPDQADEVAVTIEDRLADFGADAVLTSERLAQFHRVENTYLSTFQTLGGLGLLLGTIGLAAVLLRNVLERRRELALLGAVGFGRDRLFLMVIAESALLLFCGLAAGALCALVAIAPAALDRGGALPAGAGIWLLLFGVLAAGLVSAVVATRVAIQSRLLDALKAE